MDGPEPPLPPNLAPALLVVQGRVGVDPDSQRPPFYIPETAGQHLDSADMAQKHVAQSHN